MFVPHNREKDPVREPIMPIYTAQKVTTDTTSAGPPLQPQEGYRHSLEVVSLLLAYPEAELRCMLNNFSPPPCPIQRIPRLDAVVNTFASTVSLLPLSTWQGIYVDTFDLDPASSLHLTWHVFGDSPRQGRALAAINEIYRDAGFAPVPGELPDYLPMMLEFMAVGPEWATVCLGEKFGATLAKLTTHLDTHHSPYTPLLEHVLEVLTIPPHSREVIV
ncbi:MAG: nitrate reductase molybdenum cofactor assembly chaperone [Desulfovibrionaceae bacterium]